MVYLYTYIYYKNQPNVGGYISSMDPSEVTTSWPMSEAFPCCRLRVGDRRGLQILRCGGASPNLRGEATGHLGGFQHGPGQAGPRLKQKNTNGRFVGDIFLGKGGMVESYLLAGGEKGDSVIC